MTMADGSYDPMGHIQTGRQHPHSHHPAHHHHGSSAGGGGGGGGGGVGSWKLEQLHQLHQRYQLQQQQLHHHQQQQQSQQPSPSSLENNNNLPAATNHNLFRSEQKKHKRKRLSAVLDKLHHNGSTVNHNNNNVGEISYKIKRSASRSSAEDSTEDVFPYSASPRISVSPLRLNESDENNMNQVQIKQEPQQYLYKQLQYMNPLALFNYFPQQTKLLYQEIARQRSHSDSDLQQLPQKLPETAPAAPPEPQEPQEYPLDLSMKTKLLHTSPSLDSVIKLEPKLTYTPPPQPLPSIVKGDVASNNTKKSAAACYNLNVSPVVEEMPPGSDVAYMCPVCGQLFSLQDRLAKHMASRHKSRSSSTDITKSYICEVCQRSFARSDMLTRHMRLHTGVKPYSCKVCGQIFSRSDHLSTHQRTHTGEKPYKCPQCPYAACRRDMITRHMRTHTRYDAQRGGSSGGSPVESPSSMDQKPLLLPMVNFHSVPGSAVNSRALKKEAAFATSPGSYAIETKTES
ncbi:chorion transcription factor Cf2 [Topomyia yanbarensis]|uniref:chorion transcription factor Cf2 n=1 Tax=Topomyia yanbarensis TaxID=2498891 RepID=UPI00273CCAE5|nr:chorion transcription factor Cf2 [Topomyia yanbarensis]XP_058816539.1 chorion transcription factor Cf2 [Topomyia yanbarensis]XP_058816540.1 chorion transcription factor Cf2 [Topomyia yanbarensis]